MQLRRTICHFVRLFLALAICGRVHFSLQHAQWSAGLIVHVERVQVALNQRGEHDT